jgi:hypothetical protein
MVVGGASGRGADRRGAMLIFNRADQGNVKPRASIGGPKSGITGVGLLQVYSPRGEIILSVRGSYGEMASDEGYVGVWSITDNGDVPPRWRIGGPKGVLQSVRGVALDPVHQAVMISDKRLNAVLTFSFPEMFTPPGTTSQPER